MPEAHVQASKVKISFGHEVVLKPFNLEIAQGERFVIIGPSGHGKSVLIKTLAGLLKPPSGEVFVKGQNLYESGHHEQLAIMKKMGMLFQKNALFDSMTCLENVTFPMGQVTSLSPAEINDVARFFLDAVGLNHAIDLYPDEISGGMQKRLGNARAMALKPEVLFYDDPTAGLDPITSRKIVELIMDLNEETQSTVVLITNDMNRAFQIADRIAMVVNQEIIVTGDELQTKEHEDHRVTQFVHGRLEGPLRVVE